ncbi:MAG: DUF4230 domain-containing protein [Anaerolineae bacterium]|nr:DUF4230 domain-containing protein [Thermoflexales bacterium]MDW8407527.1 DUF4230 domain-containing protein [Anaerolineae bacterium]
MSDYNFFPELPPETPPKPARRGLPTGCYVFLGLGLLTLLFVALIIAAAVREAALAGERVMSAANPVNIVNTALAPKTPTVVVRPPAINQVKAIADLTTSSVLMSTIVEAEQARVGNIIYERLVLLACGRVKAGVDLSQLKEEDIQTSADGLTVTIRLPKPQIFDAYLIDDSTQPCTTRVYDRTNLILLPAAKDLESKAREQAVNAIRDTAIQSGVLEEADRNARAVIERLLLMSGYQKVRFADEAE